MPSYVCRPDVRAGRLPKIKVNSKRAKDKVAYQPTIPNYAHNADTKSTPPFENIISLWKNFPSTAGSLEFPAQNSVPKVPSQQMTSVFIIAIHEKVFFIILWPMWLFDAVPLALAIRPLVLVSRIFIISIINATLGIPIYRWLITDGGGDFISHLHQTQE